jgi:hypothetical protein
MRRERGGVVHEPVQHSRHAVILPIGMMPEDSYNTFRRTAGIGEYIPVPKRIAGDSQVTLGRQSTVLRADTPVEVLSHGCWRDQASSRIVPVQAALLLRVVQRAPWRRRVSSMEHQCLCIRKR